MSKPKTRTTSPADALIASHRSRLTLADPPGQACAELVKILAHNDAQTRNACRVSADAVIEMLRGLGWRGGSRAALNSLCARLYGRRSFGTA